MALNIYAELAEKDAETHRDLCKGCGEYYRQKDQGGPETATPDQGAKSEAKGCFCNCKGVLPVYRNP